MKKKIVYSVNQDIELELLKPQFGILPIARAEGGIVCMLDKSITHPRYQYGSSWRCRVMEVLPNKLIVQPIEMTISALSNKACMEILLNKLATKPKERHEKVKTNYQFSSKIEQQKRPSL